MECPNADREETINACSADGARGKRSAGCVNGQRERETKGVIVERGGETG